MPLPPFYVRCFFNKTCAKRLFFDNMSVQLFLPDQLRCLTDQYRP